MTFLLLSLRPPPLPLSAFWVSGGSVTSAWPVVATVVLEPVEVTSEVWPLMTVLKTVV